MNFTESHYRANVTKEHLAGVIDTNYAIGDNGTLDFSKDPQPAQNYVSPRVDVEHYRKTATYHVLGQLLRNFLDRDIGFAAPIPGPSFTQPRSDISKTRLVQDSKELKSNLGDEIESFYADMVLSLLSDPCMLPVTTEETTVYRSRLVAVFVYEPARLWGCYAPVIVVTLLIVIFGAFTIWQDGTTFSMGFSRFPVTTRNTTLDEISRGACLGNDPFPKDLMRTRLKFGVLPTGFEYHGSGGGYVQDVGHCAFGVPSEIRPIVGGGSYAGLRRRTIHGLEEG